MNPTDPTTGGIATAHGLAGLVLLALAVVLLFHFIGFRAIFVAGRPA